MLRPRPSAPAFRLTRFPSTAKARPPRGAANRRFLRMAIDADREEREPIAAPSLGPILPPAAPRPTLPGPREPVLFSDKSDSGDLLGVAEAVRPLAELCLAPEAQTPFLAGIVGPSGAGKSFALRRLVGAVDALANAAAKTPGGPFLSRVVIASVDAAGISGDPASAPASAIPRSPMKRRTRRPTRAGPRWRPPSATTKSSGGSKRNARRARKSNPSGPGWRNRCSTKRRARASIR